MENENPIQETPIQTPAPSETVLSTPQPKKFPLIEVLIFVLLAIVIIPSGTYLLSKNKKVEPSPSSISKIQPSPTPDPITNWKTYKNTKYSFSIEYPNDWTTRESSSSGDFWVYFSDKTNRIVYIHPAEKLKKMTLENWVDNMILKAKKTDPSFIITKTPSKIGSFSAWQVKGMATGPNGGLVYFVELNNEVFSIGAGPYFPDLCETVKEGAEECLNKLQDFKKRVELIISTLSSTEHTDTSNWKVFVNTDQNYSLKYPSDWEFKQTTQNSPSPFDFVTFTKKDASQEKVFLPGGEEAEATYFIEIRTENNTGNYQNVKDYILRSIDENSKQIMEKNFEDIQVSGVAGIKTLEAAAPSSGQGTVVYLLKNGKVYKISYGAMAHSETHNKFLSTFNEILSTFKFLE